MKNRAATEIEEDWKVFEKELDKRFDKLLFAIFQIPMVIARKKGFIK